MVIKETVFCYQVTTFANPKLLSIFCENLLFFGVGVSLSLTIVELACYASNTKTM